MSRVNKRNSSEPLKEGDLVELECVAYNSKPPANISWFNGAEPIEQLIDSSVVPHQQTVALSQPARSQRQRRLLQRNQVNRNNDGLTYNTHSFLSIKLSRHEHRAQISCQAHQNSDGSSGALRPASKSLELQVQRKFHLISFLLLSLVCSACSFVRDSKFNRHAAITFAPFDHILQTLQLC